MKVVDLATQIFFELSEPSYLTIPSVAYFIRGKVGAINNLLFEDFYIEETSGQFEILHSDGSEISEEACSVILSLYKVHDFGVQVRATLNALANDSIVEFTDNLQGSTIRRSDRNTTSKTYVSLKAAEQENLNDLIGAYRMNHTEPSQIAGDDTVSEAYNGGNYPTLRNWNVN